MQKCYKLLSMVMVIVLASFVFVGCSPKRELRRASRNLTEYSIDVVFCDEEKKLSATEKIQYVHCYDEPIDNIMLNLYGRAFRDDAKVKPYSKTKIEDCFPNGVNYGDLIIKTVMLDNKPVDFSLCGDDNNAINIVLREKLEKNKSILITIDFELILANCTHRLGYNEGKVNLGNWYPIIACMGENGYEIEPYWANGDPFYSNVANYEVSITYPNNYNLSSTGELVESTEESGVVTEKYSALAVRDFAMVLLSDAEEVSESVGDTLITVVTKSGDEWKNDYLSTAKKTVLLFNDLFGRYPYSTLNVVFTDFFQGGMEYPNLVYISNSVQELEDRKKVIIHEIAHQWWYGLVGNDEVDMAWFDEGLAEYSTLLYYENYPDEGIDANKLVKDTITSYELYLDVIKTLNLDINASMELPLDEYASEYEYVYMVYVKGLLFFDSLRETMGDADFFKFLQTIVKNYKFKNLNKAEFLKTLENVSGIEMSEFVNNWLSGKVDNFN